MTQLVSKQFFIRYFSFSATKIALFLGKTAILIFAYDWLPTVEFALMTGLISLIEIVRPITDMGAENIIYSRLGNPQRPLPRMIQKIIVLRIQLASMVSLVGMITLASMNYVYLAPLFLLPIIVAVQNTNLAMLQKTNSYQSIISLTIIALLIALGSVITAQLTQASHLQISLLLISPEVITCLLSFYFTRASWQSLVMGVAKKKLNLTKVLPYLMPSIGVGIVVMLYSRLDILYVRPVLGVQAQADFSVAFRMADPIFLVCSLASLTLLADFGSKSSLDAKKISNLLSKKINGALYLSLCIISIIIAVILYHSSMYLFNFSLVAANLLVIFVLTIPIKVLNSFYGTVLQRTGKFHLILIAVIITLTCTFLFAVLLSMLWGVMGVALALLVAELVSFIYLRKTVNNLLEKV